MENSIELIDFQYIDTKLGLSYLNNNQKLYLKILKNFLNRYKDLRVELLDNKNLNDTLHTIKGLSATLGMTALYNITHNIYETKDKSKLSLFSHNLLLVIEELQSKLKEEEQKTILIINDNIIDIDIMVDFLENKYDIIVALDIDSAIESLQTEQISIILLEASMINSDSFDIYSSIKYKKIPIIFTVNHTEEEIIEKIVSTTSSKYIRKPLNKKELIQLIKSH